MNAKNRVRAPLLALFVGLALTMSACNGPVAPGATAQSPLIHTIDNEHVIRAGYGVYPPFTQEDPATGRVTGVSVEILEEIARQVGARVEWHRLNWNTMGADLQNGQFDIVADPIFMTPQRGLEFTFSEPYSYFAIGIGVVRKGETRFRTFDDINRNGITVAVGQGTGEEAFVRARAPRAQLQSIPIGQDTASQMNAVLTSRADIAIVNLEDAQRFVAAHPDAVTMLWAGAPPAYVPAGFIVRAGDERGVDFIDVSLENLRSTGVLRAIAARYGQGVNMEEPAQNR